ncbi:hypothetical protein MLD38_004727 [Melastoma candidum]|uniref:Uncharacterized protein n=1 Tax=Melastoma candidum TaxID=119954 RepID=A0ACB9S846_9MYRT|nr:hypothetical protein MLD38_004727 [Melastoma candidum]
MGSKSRGKKAETPGDGGGSGGVTDERFSSANFDPKFQNVPKQKSKVEIDDRFQRMFTDASFSSSAAPTDKRGRPKKKRGGGGGESERSLMERYYRIGERKEEEEVEDESHSEEGGVDDVAKFSVSSDDDEDDLERDEPEEDSATTTDTDDESEEDEEGEELEENVPIIDQETSRLAVVNLDWRHVRAVDLYVLLSSFLPKNGRILSVTIYPSEFGLQRMKEEEIHGPVGLFEDDSSDDDDDEDKDCDIDNEKLRAYERSRMRHYYAVVECDSSWTADHLYKACDGGEFGRSSNVMDLRFIPDSMEFKHPPHDKATEVPENYDGKDFETRALQQSKIDLTWDEDEPDRVKTLKRKFNADQLADLEVKDFLASDDSESESEEDEDGEVSKDRSDKKGKKLEKYRALLQEVNGSDDDEDGNQDMEITFNTGLEDLSKRLMEKKDKKSETVWEAYLRKRREKKKAKKSKPETSSDEDSSDADREVTEEPDDFFLEEPPVKRSKNEKGHGKTMKQGKEKEDVDTGAASQAELELLLADDAGADAGPKGYKIKSESAKGKKGSEGSKIPSGEYDDPRFSALFTHPLYALDPTHPDFKRSAAYARQLADKQLKADRREPTKGTLTEYTGSTDLAWDKSHINKDEDRKNSHRLASVPGKTELSSLVKSVKMKSKLVQLSENGNKTSLKKKK